VFCDPQARTVTISLPTKLITLTYTDDPADPQAALPPPEGRRADGTLVRARRPAASGTGGFFVKDATSR
jgi:hypothetical protein